MSRAFVPGLTVSQKTHIRRIRELPLPGTSQCSVGDTVSAEETIAVADLPGDLLILRLSERMGIEREEVLKGLLVREGDRVQQDQVICEHAGFFGLFKTRYSAPESGVIEFISETTGHLGLRLPSHPIELSAYVEGNIVEVEKSGRVTIESYPALIQGIFGVGGERYGTIEVLPVPAETQLKVSHIPDSAKGKILVGGMAPDSEALQKAADSGAVGLITGSIDDRALRDYLGYDIGVAITGDEDIPMTVIITEAFGSIPIADRTLELCKTFDKCKASINGATQVRAGAIRPEVLIFSDPLVPLEAAVESEQLNRGLDSGSTVRVIRVPYFGELVQVTELPEEPVQIETGAKTRVLRARRSSGEEVIIPRANVELV